jgi:hypothetical protein
MAEWKEDKPIKADDVQQPTFGWDSIDVLI